MKDNHYFDAAKEILNLPESYKGTFPKEIQHLITILELNPNPYLRYMSLVEILKNSRIAVRPLDQLTDNAKGKIRAFTKLFEIPPIWKSKFSNPNIKVSNKLREDNDSTNNIYNTISILLSDHTNYTKDFIEIEDVKCFALFIDMSSKSAAEQINIILNLLKSPFLIYPLSSLNDQIKSNILKLCDT